MMIETYNTPYGQVNINVDTRRAIVKVSSGFDSALLLYMIADAAQKYNTDLEIYPVTARRMNSQQSPNLRELFDRVDNFKNAVNIVNWVRSKYPKLNIKDNLGYDSYFYQYCRHDDPILGPDNSYILAQTMPAIYAARLPFESDVERKFYIITYNGVTKNPGFELGGNNPEVKRNFKIPIQDENCASVEHVNTKDYISLHTEPFRNADKRLTFWLADQLGVLEELLQISRSCEGDKKLTNNWTEECYHCWWCYERTWAHETYKNQQPAEQEKYKSEVYFNNMKDNT